MDAEQAKQAYRKFRGLVYSIMIAVILANFDGAVINNLLPKILVSFNVGHGGSWLASSYLLGSALSLLFWGAAGDRIGHQRVLIVGLWLLLASTVLCALTGLSPDHGFAVYAFSIFRFVQGVGGGAVMTAAYALSALIHSVKRRTRNIGG